MALSLDDKLLGEKVHYYCSSSEEDDNDNDSADGSDDESSYSHKHTVRDGGPELKAESNGITTNTGPKGVIKDWREFKRLETEKRYEQELEKAQLAKKLTLTCRSHLNDEKEKEEDDKLLQELEDLEDEFLKEYRLKRIEEMRHALAEMPSFGKLISLNAGNFLEEVDGATYGITVIVHIYDQSVAACEAMNGCLMCLAEEYPTVKFCKLSASDAKMSFSFVENGVPALLVYKNKDLIGNYIRLREEFGDDFFAGDVESFLQEHGHLPSRDSMYVVRDSKTGEIRGALQAEDDSGSDFDVD
ncbi:phosducin-like protein [Plakobranchus ocellatus]|uniref:Phosducin-like protein n=1 Tax=Plakobranchus ocellatus TaxID=259542 RepID=A0AAV4A3N5_9GAST|nr:phosducin-like protein [Plakobranchus ocellatus]